MRPSLHIRAGFAVACWGLLLVSPILAQVEEPAAPQAPLATKQQIIRDRVLRLEDQMFRLSESLREEDPVQAERLEKALRRMGELSVRQDLKELVELLAREGQYGAAAERQEALLQKYGVLLDLLMREEDDEARRKEELERLEKTLERLKEIIEQQQGLKQQAESAEQTAEELQADPEAVAALQALIARQRALADKTNAALENSDPSAAGELAAEQEALQKMTSDLAGKLASEKGETAAAEEMRSAAQSMDSAQEAMGDEQLGVASDFQSDALDELERALQKLTKKPPEGKEPPAFEKMAGDQKQVQEQTAELSKQMEGGEGPQQEPAPGQAHVEQAGQHMQAAGQQLSGQNASQAKGEQQQALDQLDQAKQHLEQAIRDLKAEAQKKKLEDLEKRLEDMLTRQLGVNRATQALHELGSANWRRPEQLQLAEQGRVQRELGDAAGECLDILRDDNTTIVFPQLIEALRGDMHNAAGRLANSDVGPGTQQIQRDIVETLENLLAIIDDVQNQPPPPPSQNQQQQTNPPNDDPPLLPSSAELQMLADLQERLLLRTQAYDRQPADLDIARRLAEKQKNVAVMTTRMAERLQKRN